MQSYQATSAVPCLYLWNQGRHKLSKQKKYYGYSNHGSGSGAAWILLHWPFQTIVVMLVSSLLAESADIVHLSSTYPPTVSQTAENSCGSLAANITSKIQQQALGHGGVTLGGVHSFEDTHKKKRALAANATYTSVVLEHIRL